jgi:regulator of protease activity HflC (stomatin/prohibitin superfamily)
MNLGMTVVAIVVSFVAVNLLITIALGLMRMFGLYVIVRERQALVYVLFGNVVGRISEPGIYCLLRRIGPAALIVNWLGRCHRIDLRLDQQYLRSQAVNSEEGAPMGIGIWYEMVISDPLAFLFRNSDPRGSLAANVGSSTVRCLSNLPLERMMTDRHAMSKSVRAEVSPMSTEWGYQLGSCYVRKVHFRDEEMIKQIESKVVNRLRQVTSAIKQEGANQVNLITGAADRTAAVEFAKAGAIRPRIVGETLRRVTAEPDIADAMFTVLETQRILESKAPATFVPLASPVLTQMLAAQKAAG